MSYTFASIFSGGGLADVGLMAAGWLPLWGIEHDPATAAVYRRNIHACCYAEDACGVDFSTLARPDHLHASPPCTRASVANSEARETSLDTDMAKAVCRAINEFIPDTFTLENVYGYRKFEAYMMIVDCLRDHGYVFRQHHINAADFGVPQTRKRLVLRASLDGHLRPLPKPVPWVGWYAAIEDLIPTLPPSQFAQWQLDRLPRELFGDCLVEGDAAGERCPTRSVGQEPAMTIKAAEGGRVHRAFLACAVNADGTAHERQADEPSHSIVSTAYKATPKAFLAHGTSTLEFREQEEPSAAVMATVHAKAAMPRAFLMPLQGENAEPREPEEPALTVTANHASEKSRAFITGADAHPPVGNRKPLSLRSQEEPMLACTGAMEKSRAWLSQGRVVSMTPRALARFQSVPDWYELPASKKLACTIIGNGVPCLLMERIAESFYEDD